MIEPVPDTEASAGAFPPANASASAGGFLLRAAGLGKSYRIFSRRAGQIKAALLPWGRGEQTEFWALRGVDFEVRRGEAVGVLGRNGSGKSTLLQLAAGILQPTEGKLERRGRVSALLELGSGFNPEFTGRENVMLNGSILGIPRRRMGEIFGEIEAFADIGGFIEQPVKSYSSGMMVRLAFAVAVAVEPDMLIVDEALAVGDIAFQRKCFRRVEEMRQRGMTLLWVTHDPGLVRQVCSRAIVLEKGRVIGSGSASEMADFYLQAMYGGVSSRSAPAGNSAGRTAESPETIQAAPAGPDFGEADIEDAEFAFGAVPDALRYEHSVRRAGVYAPEDVNGHNCMVPFRLVPGRYHLEFNLGCKTGDNANAVEIMVADWKRRLIAFSAYPPLSCDSMAPKILSYDFDASEELPEAEIRVTNLGGAAIRLGSIRLWRIGLSDPAALAPVAQAHPAQMMYFDGKGVKPFPTASAGPIGLAKVTAEDECLVERAALFGGDGKPKSFFRVDDEALLVVDMRVAKPIDAFSYGFLLRDKLGQEIFGRSQTCWQLGIDGPFAPGARCRIKVRFKALLKQETYFLSFGLSDGAFLKQYFYGLDLIQMPLHHSGEPVFGLVNLPNAFEAARLDGGA